MTRLWHAALTATILVSFATHTMGAEPSRPGVVTAGVLNVRAKPARHFERIAKFRRGDAVQVIRQTEEWLEVIVPADAKAWVAKQHLDAKGVVVADTLQIRSGPGVVFTAYAKVAKGTPLKLVGPPLDEWQQILAPGDATGWVNRAYVRMQEVPRTIVSKTKPPAPKKPTEPAATVAKLPSVAKPAPPEKPVPLAPKTVAVPKKPAPSTPKTVALPKKPVATIPKPVVPAKSVAAVPEPEPKKPVAVAPTPEPMTAKTDEDASEFIRRVVRKETGVEIIIEARTPTKIVESTPEPKKPVVAAPAKPKPIEKPVEIAKKPEPKKPVVAAPAKPKPIEKPVEIAKKPEPKKPVVAAPAKPKPIEKPVEIAKKPVVAAPAKPKPEAVPKRVVDIAKKPEPKAVPTARRVAKPEPKKPVEIAKKPEPKAITTPNPVVEPELKKPIMVATKPKPPEVVETNGETIYEAPIRAPKAPTMRRPTTPKPRYEVPVFVAKAAKPTEAVEPEPEPKTTEAKPTVTVDVPETPAKPATAVEPTDVPAKRVVAIDPETTPEAPVPAVAAPDAPSASQPSRPERVWQEGVLFSLKDQAVPEASHILYRREGTVCYPICYLRSTRIPLVQWEMREVRLYGEKMDVPGWSRPVFDVRGVQLKTLE